MYFTNTSACTNCSAAVTPVGLGVTVRSSKTSQNVYEFVLKMLSDLYTNIHRAIGNRIDRPIVKKRQ